MSADEIRSRVPEEVLRRHLSRIYRYGYWISLLLIAFGVLIPYIAADRYFIGAVAGVVVLLSTPLVAAVWVGVAALTRRDRGLAMIVAGILLLLAVRVLLQVA